MSDTTTFLAVLSGSTALRFDADGGGKVTFQFDDQQTVGLVRLLTMRHKLLEVTVTVKERY